MSAHKANEIRAERLAREVKQRDEDRRFRALSLALIAAPLLANPHWNWSPTSALAAADDLLRQAERNEGCAPLSDPEGPTDG